MAKGISLEQFKNQLDTDAQKRCLVQEKTIRELSSQVKSLNELLKDRDNLTTVLQNRCFALGGRVLCLFCGCKNTCTAYKGHLKKEVEVDGEIERKTFRANNKFN